MSHGIKGETSAQGTPKGTTICGIVGVVFGALGLVLSFIPIVNNIAAILGAIGVVLAIIGLIVVRALFLEKALDQFYQANLIAKVDYADILYYSAPWMLILGLAMSGITSYVTLRLYVRR